MLHMIHYSDHDICRLIGIFFAYYLYCYGFFQTKLMSLKDERMKIMNEVLSGVKVLIQTLNIAFVTLSTRIFICGTMNFQVSVNLSFNKLTYFSFVQWRDVPSWFAHHIPCTHSLQCFEGWQEGLPARETCSSNYRSSFLEQTEEEDLIGYLLTQIHPKMNWKNLPLNGRSSSNKWEK